MSLIVRRGRLVLVSPRCSICVLVLRDVTMVEKCLDSLRDTVDKSMLVEVVVVANGTPLSTLEPIRGRDDIVLVSSGTNLGFAGGNNLAAEISRANDYLVFVNDDTIVERGWLQRLTHTMEQSPKIGAVGSRIMSPTGDLREAGSVIWGDGSTTAVGQTMPARTSEFQYVRDVDFCSANGLMVRRTAWEAVGGFDEGYFPAYQEDSDLGMALRARGYRVLYEPRARLVHLESRSTGLRFREFLCQRHRRYFAEKWAGELASHEPPPRPGAESVAVARAVHRARGAPPRALLVVDEFPDADSTDGSARAMEAVDGLSAAGCAVVVARRSGRLDKESTKHATALDRLVDLGVDVRPGRPESVLSRAQLPFDVVVWSSAKGLVGFAPFLGHALSTPALVLDARADETTDAALDAASLRLADHVVVSREAVATKVMEIVGEDHVTVVDRPRRRAGAPAGYDERIGVLHVARWREGDEDEELEALRFLVKEVLPAIVARVPWVHVFVSGADPPARVLQFGGPNVEFIGLAGSCSTPFDRVNAVVVADPRVPRPERVLQALRAGTPTVGHSEACRGLVGVEAEAVIMSDDPSVIANELVELLSNPTRWAEQHRRVLERLRFVTSRPVGSWNSVLEAVGVKPASRGSTADR